MQRTVVDSEIARLGTRLGPDVLAAVHALYDEEQTRLSRSLPAGAANLAYGPHERHVLDIYGGSATAKPTILFVHGGGFVRGDKGGDMQWPNAAVGRMAARAGFVGAVMNYRLAPAHGWPAGGEDVMRALDWLQTSCAEHGVDPARIVLVGTSAGAVHIATYLALEPGHAGRVRGAVLLSGLYGYTPLDPPDHAYYGEDGLYPERMPREAVAATELPLMIACAQFDPPRFQAEFLGLMAERFARHGRLPKAHFADGHNHYSIAMHLGTSDRRLADEIVNFVQTVTD